MTFVCARAIAEEFGAQLRTPPWVGQKIFQLDDPTIQEQSGIMCDENDLKVSEAGVCDFRSYAQCQKAIDFYSRSDVKRWLRWRPEVLQKLKNMVFPQGRVCHFRRTDYFGYGYVVVSQKSYEDCLRKNFGFVNYFGVGDEKPFHFPEFTGELNFLPDFYRLMTAEVLLRANSSFSFFAAVLADDSQRVFAPIIDGKPGGVESDCEFVEGNWPRLHYLDFTTDLHLRP